VINVTIKVCFFIMWGSFYCFRFPPAPLGWAKVV
jgi:hypothetical protein